MSFLVLNPTIDVVLETPAGGPEGMSHSRWVAVETGRTPCRDGISIRYGKARCFRYRARAIVFQKGGLRVVAGYDQTDDGGLRRFAAVERIGFDCMRETQWVKVCEARPSDEEIAGQLAWAMADEWFRGNQPVEVVVENDQYVVEHLDIAGRDA